MIIKEILMCGEYVSGANLHVLHIKNASLDILISYSYEELLQMNGSVGMGGKDANEFLVLSN